MKGGCEFMELMNELKRNDLLDEWKWINEPDTWSIEENNLVILAPPISNYFIDEEGPSVETSAPFLYTLIKGDFSFTTRVEVDMNSMFDSGCIMIMSDMNHWAKLCYENWLNEPSIVSVVTNTISDDCPSLRIGKEKPYLKVLRSGNCFGFHYSLNGKDWTIIRYFNMNLPEEIKVGVVAQCPLGEGCNIRFDLINLENHKIPSAKNA
jgi:regulation of enolase protein 1 (concanavalin A-like superfamily)